MAGYGDRFTFVEFLTMDKVRKPSAVGSLRLQCPLSLSALPKCRLTWDSGRSSRRRWSQAWRRVAPSLVAQAGRGSWSCSCRSGRTGARCEGGAPQQATAHTGTPATHHRADKSASCRAQVVPAHFRHTAAFCGSLSIRAAPTPSTSFTVHYSLSRRRDQAGSGAHPAPPRVQRLSAVAASGTETCRFRVGLSGPASREEGWAAGRGASP
jgi:hypothetical protein